jgi:hypothetical protein
MNQLLKIVYFVLFFNIVTSDAEALLAALHPPLNGGTNSAATTRHLYVVCIYGSICLQILFINHHILLFLPLNLDFFA